jgi:hypothetical protein
LIREFVITHDFDKYWEALGFTDGDLVELQNTLLENPKTGVVIPRTNGARKIRIEANEHGKRGGARVVYVDIVVLEQIYLLLAYPKNKKDDLTSDEEKAISVFIKSIKEQETGGL